MSQGDVIAWLRHHPGWRKTSEVIVGLGQGYKGVQLGLSKAAMWGDIESRKDGLGKEWRALDEQQ